MPDLDNRRIVNPVLTNLGIAYMGQQPYPGMKLWPQITVAKEEGSYISLSNEWKFAHSDSFVGVGMGAEPKFIDYDQTTATYKLDEYAIGTKIYRRELAENNNILNLRKLKTQLVTQAMALNLEKRIATEVQDDTNYDSSNVNTLNGTAGSYYWSDTTDGDPLKNIITGVDEIRDDVGMLPNVCVIAYDAAVLAGQNPNVGELLYPNSSTSPTVTPMQAVKILMDRVGITEWYVGSNNYVSTVGGSFTDVWTESCILAYKDIALTPNAPTFGVTLRKTGYPIMQTEILPLSDNTEAITMRDITKAHAVNWDSAYLIENTQG